MEADLTGAMPFSKMTLDEIEKYFDETIGKSYLDTLNSGKVFLQKTKERLIGITANQTGLDKIKETFPIKPDEILKPSVVFRGELANLYAGVNVILVKGQVEGIKYWFDQDSLDLYLQTKENKN